MSEFGIGDNPFMMPRAHIPSIMNYPQLYKLGHNAPPGHDGSDSYWQDFRFAFDDIELQHIRHHAHEEVMFGGESFGIYGHSRAIVEDPREIQVANQASKLRLQLRGKRIFRKDMRFYELMEPLQVELKVSTKSDSDIELSVPVNLDGSFLEVFIKNPSGAVKRFRSLARVCTDLPRQWTADVAEGKVERELSLYDLIERGARFAPNRVAPDLPLFRTMDLTYGGDGFYFSEPGTYLIRAVYYGGAGLETYSNVLRIQVGTPKSPKQESVAADFFEPRKGSLLATGPTADPRFGKEIDFFKEVESEFRDTAMGRALAGYLGESRSRKFKAVRRGPGRRPRIDQIEPKPEEAIPYLDRALKFEESGEAGLTREDSPSNLVRFRMGLSRARLTAMTGDRPGAERFLMRMREHASELIGDRPRLLRRELSGIAALEGDIQRGILR
jgi:hypothetical protein